MAAADVGVTARPDRLMTVSPAMTWATVPAAVLSEKTITPVVEPSLELEH